MLKDSSTKPFNPFRPESNANLNRRAYIFIRVCSRVKNWNFYGTSESTRPKNEQTMRDLMSGPHLTFMGVTGWKRVKIGPK
jgi:hypothetical protein